MKKILHICLTGAYQDNMGYDENILSKYHARMGYKVYILSCFDKDNLDNRYINKDGVRVIRINKKKNTKGVFKLGYFPQLFTVLNSIEPDLIYVHNAQFISFWKVIYYVKHSNAKLFVDNHADYYNSPVNSFKSFLEKYIIFRFMFMISQKYVVFFRGVTPWRCQYLNRVYGVSKKKIKLLIMGADDEKIDFENENVIRKSIRGQYGIQDEDFVIISGGKIDKTKNIHLLVKAIKNINNSSVKLLLFGNMEDEMETQILRYVDNKKIIYLGWLKPYEVYDYYLASDLAYFPGTHSVLWEQACACGLPIIVKRWKMMDHIDMGGNAFFIDHISIKKIKHSILYLLNNYDQYLYAKSIAQNNKKEFAYSSISQKAIRY